MMMARQVRGSKQVLLSRTSTINGGGGRGNSPIIKDPAKRISVKFDGNKFIVYNDKGFR